MVTHPRTMDNMVRKTDDRRKRKRAEKAERKAAEASAQQQEVKRLKNLKGQQIQERYASPGADLIWSALDSLFCAKSSASQGVMNLATCAALQICSLQCAAVAQVMINLARSVAQGLCKRTSPRCNTRLHAS